ncbi:hypothetical protein LTR53_013427 [Teratosphaeriaceae sp. CCFEE 6253]|nr:hypothetical protein LTR53_013427 [Teratosphaeriaceae sp. CCFEE 6253]
MSPDPTPPPPYTPLTLANTEALRLLWHILHLCNTLISQLGAFLSLESLHRDTITISLSVPTAHYPLMVAQTAMMVDECKNLDAAVEALARRPERLEIAGDGSAYQCVLDAAKKISTVVGMLSTGVTSKERVETLRRIHDELVLQCYGDAGKGVQGWKEAWNEVTGLGVKSEH